MKPAVFLIAGGGLIAGFAIGALTAPARHRSEKNPAGEAAETSAAPASAASPALAKAKDFIARPAGLRDLAELGRTLEKVNAAGLSELLDWIEANEVDFYGSAQGRLAWVFEWWLARDVTAARIWLEPRLLLASQDGPQGRGFGSSERERAMAAWSKKEPEAALKFAREHAQTGLAKSLLRAAIDAWPDPDPSARLAVLRGFPESEARDAATDSLFTKWAATNPAEALAAAGQLDSVEEKERVTREVFTAWPEGKAVAAFEEYQRLDLSEPRLLSKLLGEVASSDLPQALEWLGKLSPQEIGQVGSPIVAAWAKSDPAAALQWTLDNGISFRGASPASGMERYLDDFGTGMSGNFAPGTGPSPLAAALATKSDATIEWIRSIPDDVQRNRLLTQMVTLSGDLDQVLRLFNELSPEAAAVAAGTVVSQFAGNLERGLEWAAGLPPGPVRAQAWRALGGWLPLEPENLSAADRDAFLTGAMTKYGPGSSLPPVAERLELVQQIQDDVLRRDAFDNTMEQMTGRRGEQAREWMEQAALPEEWKRAWRK